MIFRDEIVMYPRRRGTKQQSAENEYHSNDTRRDLETGHFATIAASSNGTRKRMVAIPMALNPMSKPRPNRIQCGGRASFSKHKDQPGGWHENDGVSLRLKQRPSDCRDIYLVLGRLFRNTSVFRSGSRQLSRKGQSLFYRVEPRFLIKPGLGEVRERMGYSHNEQIEAGEEVGIKRQSIKCMVVGPLPVGSAAPLVEKCMSPEAGRKKLPASFVRPALRATRRQPQTDKPQSTEERAW